eukprot:1139987-Pelagomonas_calceolata.AAC.8
MQCMRCLRSCTHCTQKGQVLTGPPLSQLRYFNYDGRADERIVRKVLSDIAPRALAITRGTESARYDLCAKIAKELAGLGSRVAAPGEGLPELSSLHSRGQGMRTLVRVLRWPRGAGRHGIFSGCTMLRAVWDMSSS